MTGISSYGVYVPRTRLPLAMISGGRVREGSAEKAVAFYDEDSVTMAVSAAVECLNDVDRSSVDALYFASTTYAFEEKQGAALIAKALDLGRDVRCADFSGSLRAGTNALTSAVDAVTAGAVNRILVVASDRRVGAPRGGLERNFGDGAAAFLVDGDAAVAVLEESCALADEIQDVWRNEGDPFTHSWEDRFAVSEGYLRNVEEIVGRIFLRSNTAAGAYARLVLYAPDARSHAAMAKKLGFAAEQIQEPFFGRIGNTGVSFAPLLLAAALEKAQDGDRLLVVSYGDGAEAMSLRVRQSSASFRSFDWHLQRGVPLRAYDSYLRSRGLQTAEWKSGNGGGLSATIRYRERDADISMVGGRCTVCGSVHFPQPRVCHRCYAKDQWARERLSDKRGGVLAFTFDYFFPSPEPPTIMTVIDIDGCRLHLQMCDALPDQVRLDMPVEMVFRKIHDAGNKPNYFWKARPVDEGAQER